MMSNVTDSKARSKGINLWFISILISVSIMGCQEEESFIRLPPDDSAITIASPVVPLLLQVARLNGSADNILDQSSCLTVVLPVTVIVDDKTIIVNSPADFDLVEDALDDDDDGKVEFVFPIIVILPDYSRITVSNKTDLNELIDSCDDEDDIECIDIKYPLTIRVYDINNQVSDVITISSDEALYNFLSQLLENTYISIQFPVTLISSNGSELVVGNYDELENAILLSEDDCDDGDDVNFIQVLTSVSWRIDSFINDDEDQTSDWEDYVLIFNPDGTLTASNGTNEFKGTWETDTDDGSIKLDIQLNAENPYDALNEDWTVTQYDLLQIILEDEDDQEPYDLKKLVLKKI